MSVAPIETGTGRRARGRTIPTIAPVSSDIDTDGRRGNSCAKRDKDSNRYDNCD